jgi:uncharacterized membrane protein YjgN (DUF898 family)
MNDVTTPQATSPVPKLARHRIDFRGNASEYFGIWIVNVVLTLLTVGIYSAWAKVRRKRYFYGNTFLAGHSFEYHARPIRILQGRLIAVGIIIVFNLIAEFFPIFGAVVLLVYAFALPFIINMGLRFNARMTSYRNVRFNFAGNYWEAFIAFILLPLAALFTLGLLVPVMSQVTATYIAKGYRYGTAPFAAKPLIRAYYGVFFRAFLFAILVAALIGGAVAMVLVATDGMFAGAVVVAILTFYLTIIPAAIFYAAGARNVIYNALALDNRHRFESTLKPLRYVWIIVSNFFVTIATFGLMRAWAAIRSTRYIAAHTAVLISGTVDDYVGEIESDTGVAAAEYMDLEGFDLGF